MNPFNFNIISKEKPDIKSLFTRKGYIYSKDRFRICTYLHYYDNEKYPFYIGSGTLLRAFDFNRHCRTKHWNDKVKDFTKIDVIIYKVDITKKEAQLYEEQLISKYIDYNCLCNIRNTDIKYAKYKINHTVDKRNWACFDLNGRHIKTFETLEDAAKEYLTYPSIIKRCAKNNTNFRGIIKWVKI